jgi:hypothetical protein
MTKQSLFRTQDGVSFTLRAADKSDAKKNVTPIGWARARDGTGWQLVLAFADRDGHRHELLVKRREVARGDLLFDLLDDHGYPVPVNPHSCAELRRSIVSANPEPRFRIEARGKLVPEHGSDKAVQTAVAKIIERLPKLAKHAVDLSKRKHRVDAKAAALASVLRIKHRNGERLLAVRPTALTEMIGSAVSEKAVAAELEKRDVLVPRSNGRRTRELRLPGGNVRRSYYCLRLSPAKPGSSKLHRKHD